MTVKKSDAVRLSDDDCRMLMMEGVNRPVMKQLCIWGVFASMTVWSQEQQHNQGCLSRRADKATVTERNNEDKGELAFIVCVNDGTKYGAKCFQVYYSVQCSH